LAHGKIQETTMNVRMHLTFSFTAARLRNFRPPTFGAVCAALCTAVLASMAAAQTRCVADIPTPPNAHSLTVSAASYVGLGASDTARGIALAPDCTLVLAATLSGTSALTDTANIADPLAPANPGSTGAVIRLSADGTSIVQRAKVGAAVNDIAINATNGDIALATDIGVVVLASDFLTVRWRDLGVVAARVDIATTGEVVALRGGTQTDAMGDRGQAKTYTIYRPDGSKRFERTSGYSFVGDVAIDATSQRVFTTGYAQRDGSSCTKLQVAHLRAFDFDGVEQWVNYDYARGVADANSDCADSRGRFVAMGGDGKLYFAGTSAGGNSIFRWKPGQLGTAANNAKPGADSHVDPYNTASNHITYAARFEPLTGAHTVGFFLLSRLDTTKGNTIEPRAIAGDQDGRFYVGGFSAYQIKNRALANINGQTLAAYAGEDAWLLVTSPDVTARETWISLNNGGNATVRGIAVGRGTAAIAASVNKAPMFVSGTAVQSTGPSATEKSGYFAAWSTALGATPVACNLDIDGVDGAKAATDGLMVERYLRNARGAALTSAAKQDGLNATAIETNIQRLLTAGLLDIDGNGTVDAATDGVLLLRALFGFRDAALTDGALGAAPATGMWRNTGALIRAYLADSCGLPR
jgi:hypothetical protein